MSGADRLPSVDASALRAQSETLLTRVEDWMNEAKKQPTLYFGGTALGLFCIFSLLLSMGIQQTEKLDSRMSHLDEWVDDDDDDVALHHHHHHHLAPGCKHPAVTQGATISWVTADSESDRKYLLLDCWIGQISNRKQCIINHMVVAGLLNRTLVVPHAVNTFMEEDKEYDLRVIWDLESAKKCVGEHSLMWLDEYFDHQGQHFDHELRSFEPEESNLPSHHGNPHVPVDYVHCLHGPVGHCSSGDGGPKVAVGCPLISAGSKLEVDEKELSKGFPGLKLKVSSAEGSSACLGGEPSVKQILEAFSDPSLPQFTAKVLVVGDIEAYVFNDPDWGLVKPADVNPSYYIPMGGVDPFTRLPGCPPTHKGLMLPPMPILKRAKSVALSLYGDAPSPTGGDMKVIAPFVSFHWRRGEFKDDYCGEVPGKNSRWCFKTPEEVAKCVNAVMTRNNVSSLFLATNAQESEADAFYTALKALHGDTLVLRQYLEEDWAWLGEDDFKGVDLNTQQHTIQATLDKAVAALGSMFVGSDVSKFSMDIYRMRVGLGRDSTCDTIISHCDSM